MGRRPASDDGRAGGEGGGKTLIVYVHGFGGDEVLGRAAASHPGEPVSVYGEFLAFHRYFVEYLGGDGRGRGLVELVYRYDTHSNPNIAGARVLNLQLKGAEVHGPVVDARKGGFDRIVFITLSNGNLVAREAVLQALGFVDRKKFPSGAPPKWAARPPGISDEDWRIPIARDEELVGLYRKAKILDVSPILGGAADARGALVVPRYMELDPFGPHQRWLFSDENVDRYDAAIEGRHDTFFVCGDPFTRGIWNLFSSVDRVPPWNFLTVLGALTELKPWTRGNFDWWVHFERARGSGRGHHVEYVPALGPESGDGYCDRKDYVEGMRLRLQDERTARRFSVEAAGTRVAGRLEERRGLANADFYAETMSLDPDDYDLEAFELAHPPVESRYHDLLLDGLRREPPSKRTLDERHTSLVFYRPLMKRIADAIFEHFY